MAARRVGPHAALPAQRVLGSQDWQTFKEQAGFFITSGGSGQKHNAA